MQTIITELLVDAGESFLIFYLLGHQLKWKPGLQKWLWQQWIGCPALNEISDNGTE